MDPPSLIDFSDDAVSSATSHSYTDPHGTRIFDRYLSSSSASSAAVSSDDEDGDTAAQSLPSTSTIKRLDYMIDFLDRKLSTSDDRNRNRRSSASSSLPEFVGRGGDHSMFRPPVRAAVHPSRPPSLEVRPHPLRETQVGCFLRTIVCTEKQVWAGGENGMRVWSLRELYSESRREEDGTAPFKESVKGVSAVLCLVGDEGSGVVWSGHRDGRVRCWKMNHSQHGRLSDAFREVLSWQAHRGPVLSLCISCYGIISTKMFALCSLVACMLDNMLLFKVVCLMCWFLNYRGSVFVCVMCHES